MSDTEIFIGGVYGVECRKLFPGEETTIKELSSNEDQAENRIMFHINDGINHGFQSSLVDSSDTVVFVNITFRFRKTSE